MRCVIAVLVAVAAAGPLAAQRLVVGVQGAFGEYREVNSGLRYKATGVAATATVNWRKFGADVTATSLSYEPDDSGLAIDEFTALQLDLAVRYRVYHSVSLELGVTNRDVKEDFAAQSAGAIRIGVHSTATLGPTSGVMARAAYLAGAKFSGGGTAPFGLDVAFGFHYGFGQSGRVRLTGDYQYQRFNRTVDTGSGDADAPIQQGVARLGLAVAF